MAEIGILDWQNENAYSPYPLTTGFGYNGFFLDANFIQFDNFIPTLQTISVEDDSVDITILFDSGPKVITLARSFFTDAGVFTRVYDGARYLGKIVFGADVGRLVDNDLANRTIKKINIPFLSHLVKSIPSKAGVFSIDSLYGDVVFNHDTHVWYDVTGNNVTFNAISGIDYQDIKYLKTLNSTGPINNSVYMKDNQVIKITSIGNAAIEISLVGNAIVDAAKSDSIIVSSG